jgi:hypothetical protein
VDILLGETRCEIERRGGRLRLVAAVAPPRPVFAVYVNQDGSLCTSPVVFFHSYEVIYPRREGGRDFDTLTIPVVIENGTLEEEDLPSFIGLSLDEVPRASDWAAQINDHAARHRA